MIETNKEEKQPCKNIELKPCPCCGSSKVEIKTPMARYFTFYYVECGCGIRTIDFPILEEAIRVWNNRLEQE